MVCFFMTDKNPIAFVAEYDDGSEDYFRVHVSTLERGDHVARLVAGEW